MKDTLRCCISCILPCGALDVIRIVHASGRVEEISGTVSAAEIMQLYPQHVLRKPPSGSSDGVDDGVPKAVTLPPNAKLQKGEIYFLMPVSISPASGKARSAATGARGRRRKKKEADSNNAVDATDKTRLLLNDRYLSEILSENATAAAVSTQRESRRRGRVGVWRPHLESISEVTSDL